MIVHVRAGTICARCLVWALSAVCHLVRHCPTTPEIVVAEEAEVVVEAEAGGWRRWPSVSERLWRCRSGSHLCQG